MGAIYEATWERGFAALYDLGFRQMEEGGLREIRRETLKPARGRTVDIGAGTGLNLDLFPHAVSELTLVEPSVHMAAKLREKVARGSRAAEVVEAPAESMPFPDATFDTAVFGLVLCTVGDPDAALAEVARVLKPGGRMLFFEHVRAESPRVARWQDRIERPWRFIAAGCHANRDTEAAISRSPLEIERLEHGRLPKAMPLMRPLIRGSARLPA